MTAKVMNVVHGDALKSSGASWTEGILFSPLYLKTNSIRVCRFFLPPDNHNSIFFRIKGKKSSKMPKKSVLLVKVLARNALARALR